MKLRCTLNKLSSFFKVLLLIVIALLEYWFRTFDTVELLGPSKPFNSLGHHSSSSKCLRINFCHCLLIHHSLYVGVAIVKCV